MCAVGSRSGGGAVEECLDAGDCFGCFDVAVRCDRAGFGEGSRCSVPVTGTPEDLGADREELAENGGERGVTEQLLAVVERGMCLMCVATAGLKSRDPSERKRFE